MTTEQRLILHHLAGGNLLIKDRVRGSWFDSTTGKTFAPAACAYLARENYLTNVGRSPQFEKYELSEKGSAAIAARMPDIERMVQQLSQ